MAYPKRYERMWKQDIKKATFYRFRWEQDFQDEDISFDPWFVTKGEHLDS